MMGPKSILRLIEPETLKWSISITILFKKSISQKTLIKLDISMEVLRKVFYKTLL